MPYDRALHREAARRRRAPAFARLSRALAAAVATGSTEPLREPARAASLDDLLFAVSIHGVAGLLSAQCERAPGTLPAEVEDALAAARGRARQRGRRLAEDLVALGRRAERSGLPLVPLKGAALAPLAYRDLSLRPMSDLDLLAVDADFEAWCRVLAEEGYAVEKDTFKNRVFVRPAARVTGSGFVEDPDNPRPVELHGRVRERFLGRVVDVTDELLRTLEPARLHGEVDARVPAGSGMALHLFAHIAPEAVGRGARLIAIHDFRHLDPDARTAEILAGALGDGAWGVAALFERAVPGILPPRLASDLLARAPAPRRRKAWLARPGLLTGEEDRTPLVLAELPLCDTPRAALRRVLDAVPDRDVLDAVYGAGSVPAWGLALGRWYRDRLR